MLESGNKIKMCSFKHDGKVHRIWDRGTIIEETESFIVVGNTLALVSESDGRIWQTREPAVTIFYKELWLNVIAMLRETGIHYYCNIASPYVIQNQILFYIDYDLDISLSPTNEIRILDEWEYDLHRTKLGYSTKLDFVLKETLKFLKETCEKRFSPFIDEKIYEYYKKFLDLEKKNQ